MKKINVLFAMVAFAVAGAGVFASHAAQRDFVIRPSIDSNNDGVCDQEVPAECTSLNGSACTYEFGSGNVSVHDLNSPSCTVLKRP